MELDGLEAYIAELDEFADDLESIADEIDEAIDEGTRRTALSVEVSAKEFAPVKTGDLKGDIAAIKLGPAKWSVGSTKEYAPPTEYGSKPHPITPDAKEYLHFFIDGDEIFTKHVDHPGTPAQPFLRPAIHRHRSDLVNNIADEIDKVIEANR